ncbi:ATP-binding protein [Butyrivibrio sp. FCS006]|uniref:ATP-binding protein n=1 Tax=Butyrivibrio sp. FCS006 TaxID=1280684 RepID=UPI0004078AF0|nr:transporter substrate-binding domain-containing protein [Butyrivibrio sp. FCS006]
MEEHKRSKKRRPAILFLLAICMILTSIRPSAIAYAADEQKKVKVGYFENEIFQEGAGEGRVRKGYAYEYYQKIAEYTGWEYEYVYGSFSDLYRKLLAGDIDLLAGLAYTPEREGVIGYPRNSMGRETYNLVKHAFDDSINNLPATLSGKKIGVQESAIVATLNEFLESHNILADVVTFKSADEMVAAFDNEELDVYVAESNGTYNRENAELLYAFGATDYYLCVNINRQDLLNELNEAQEQIMIEEPNYINGLNIKYYPSSITSRSFSGAEKRWLSEHDTLRVGYLNNYIPYSDTDKEGNVTGLVKDLIPEMLRELGISTLSVEYIGYDSYDDMITAIGEHQIETAFPVGGGFYFSEENNIYQTNPVIASTTAIVYSGEYTESKLSTFALNKNNSMQYYFVKSNFPNAQVTFYDSIEEALDAVIEGKAGCTTLNGMRVNNILKNRKYRELSVKQQSKVDERCFGVHLGHEGLLKLLNRGLNVVGNDQIQDMALRYSGDLYKYGLKDSILDNMWFAVLIVFVISSIIVASLIKEVISNKRRASEREADAKELQKKNIQLGIAVREAEEANKAKDVFLSSMSHDIRTPMNSILSMNEMILRESKDENILEYSGHILSSGKTLLGIINDILDFTKIEAGKMEIVPIEYEISSVLNDLVNIAKAMTEEKGLLLELNIDSGLPNYLRGDEIRIKQAVTNLITNAVKYTKEGSVTIGLGFARMPGDDKSVLLNFSVKDTGIGIKEEEINKIFEAFERLDKKKNQGVEGTGLGITITQKLLNLMGSTLEVESVYGEGSSFSFTLKQEVLKWDAVGDFEAAFRKSIVERSKYKEKFTAPDANVLVVDDTPVNLTVFKNLLKHTKLRIDEAISADECIERASRKKYDLIFLDHMMPHKDGIEALKELKAMKDNPNIETPIVCLTANAIAGMREVYISAGFDDYLAKPINPLALENMIIKYLPNDKICPVSKEGNVPQKTDEIPMALYELEGLNVFIGIKHCGDKSSYLETLRTYKDSAPQTIADIESYWEKRDILNLTTMVHGIKSSSRIIGASELADLAEKLEKAGRVGDEETLFDGLSDLMLLYRDLTNRIVVPDEKPVSEDGRRVLDRNELKSIYVSLRSHLDNGHYKEVESIGELLKNSAVPEDERDRVENIIEVISAYDYDDVYKFI